MSDQNTDGLIAGSSDKSRNAGKSGQLPIGRNEDVEFAEAIADADDREAERRAEQADARAEFRTDDE